MTRWFGTNTDITARLELEELQALLLKELSHRVKNSLTLVTALLHLQARNMEGPTRCALEDAASRVRAVATVHDQLWRQPDAREIDLQPFLADLGDAIAAGAPLHDTVVQVEPAMISADMAVPNGLLVNELVTNAYKYAYADGVEGQVRICGRRSGDDHYVIEVSDSGRGLPPDFEIGKSAGSLGMRVISSLTKQLDATITASSANPGARFQLRFSLTR